MRKKEKLCIEDKINEQLLFIAILAMITTMIVSIAISYINFDKQVKKDLQISAKAIVQSYEFTKDIDELANFDEDLRITLVSPKGTILFENEADSTKMDNHKDRPEIKQARKNGHGESSRMSKTVGVDTYYYAVRVSDNNILRVSMSVRNMFAIFAKSIPLILIMGVVIVLISVYLASLFTKKLTSPIVDMAKNIDEIDKNVPYLELKPFASAIKNQQIKKKEIERMRKEFTANVSHELKTPLTSISGYAEMIENGMAKNEDIKSFAEKIHNEAGRLITLIGDIIQLSELDEIIHHKEFSDVNLYEIATGVLGQLKLNAEKSGVALNITGKTAHIFGNSGMIAELIYNLCDNAIRYNVPGGTVTISVEQNEKSAILSVKDTGIGIPEEHIDRIFERFYRVDKSRSKETGGTGLGLAIVKHIAIQHDAKISVESKKDKGTAITVAFDLFGKNI